MMKRGAADAAPFLVFSFYRFPAREQSIFQRRAFAMSIAEDAQRIIRDALRDALPDSAVQKALRDLPLSAHERVILIAVGKAAWQMAAAAREELGGRVTDGVVITKHGHAKGEIPGVAVMEAGHPIPDEDTLRATRAALQCVKSARPDDAVLFLVSGGGSALFEDPVVPLKELESITAQMLAAGCDIVEMNTVRKRLSRVKGGRFALWCAPRRVYQVVLSDIVGDPLDMIASGPAYPDSSTGEDAKSIVRRYHISLSPAAAEALDKETPKALSNVETVITGSVTRLCLSACRTAAKMGYMPVVLTSSLRCEARDAGSMLASIAEYHQPADQSVAFIMGGETVVHVKGGGRGGRNQEIVLSAARHLKNCRGTLIFSLGSDGTDGPTDAAGGMADENTWENIKKAGVDPQKALENNDAYTALKAADALIFTGPTGTNVNDLSVLLIKR